jgi:hypothetical protein
VCESLRGSNRDSRHKAGNDSVSGVGFLKLNVRLRLGQG